MQTEELILAGRAEMDNFAKLIQVWPLSIIRCFFDQFAMKLYRKKAKNTAYEKNWNFIKMHLQSHAYDDILAKGVTRNYNTKPNEKMHGPLRDIYHERTNFRDAAKQVCLKTTLFFCSKIAA